MTHFRLSEPLTPLRGTLFEKHCHMGIGLLQNRPFSTCNGFPSFVAVFSQALSTAAAVCLT